MQQNRAHIVRNILFMFFHGHLLAVPENIFHTKPLVNTVSDSSMNTITQDALLQ